MNLNSNNGPNTVVQFLQPNDPKSPELDLISFEKLDRSSPELWPEVMPGICEFATLKTPEKPAQHQTQAQPKWMSDLDKDDLDMLNELGSLNTVQLMEKVKDLMNTAYQLGLEESIQMTRGRLLNVLDSKSEDN